jgi:hypothetical protein
VRLSDPSRGGAHAAHVQDAARGAGERLGGTDWALGQAAKQELRWTWGCTLALRDKGPARYDLLNFF